MALAFVLSPEDKSSTAVVRSALLAHKGNTLTAAVCSASLAHKGKPLTVAVRSTSLARGTESFPHFPSIMFEPPGAESGRLFSSLERAGELSCA